MSIMHNVVQVWHCLEAFVEMALNTFTTSEDSPASLTQRQQFDAAVSFDITFFFLCLALVENY